MTGSLVSNGPPATATMYARGALGSLDAVDDPDGSHFQVG